MKDFFFTLALVASTLAVSLAAAAEEPASITAHGTVWTLRNDTLQVTVSFAEGKLRLDSLQNRAAHVDYLKGRPGMPLFAHWINGACVAADDGRWTLDGAQVKDIELYGKHWGKRLEITLSRTEPAAFSTRQVFEIYDGLAALRYASFVKNGTDKELTIEASQVFAADLPDRPHTLYFVEGISRWTSSREGLARGGRNCIVRYDDGHGLFVIPENNWATCLEPGADKGLAGEKLLRLNAWQQVGTSGPTLSVDTNPKAIQLVLFPHEEVEYFAVNLGVFQGDALDGRMAAAEHLRKRFRYHDPSHILSTNDWQWGAANGKRSDAMYRRQVIPKAAAAGFDRIHIDDFWYQPQDGCDPLDHWTDMPSLCDAIVARGMKPGHWFSLQGKICFESWGNGRDCADPANIDFKLKQMKDILIGKYHTAWDQLDAGLLWKTDKLTGYSHPTDSVYRKILGMRRT